MSDFKAKMHQIQFPLGSAPETTGEFTVLPRPPIAGIKGAASRQGGELEGMGIKGWKCFHSAA